MIGDPSAPQLQLGPGEEFVEPQLAPGNPLPVYPAALLPLALPPHTIAVRVTFGERGEVLSVTSSPVAASTDDQYRTEFENAARDAVSRWKCWPSRIRKFRQGPGYRILVSERIFKTFFDVAFSFEIVNGKAVVRRAQ